MHKLFIYMALFLFAGVLTAQSQNTIKLTPPNKARGTTIMKAFDQRASQRQFKSEQISIADLSDLLWAANGINRATDGKRTSASAQNAQDVEIYIANPEGIYYYNYKNNQLNLVASGDYRKDVASKQETFAIAPIFVLLVSDISRFKSGTDEQRLNWGCIDVGIVSQNIMLFCASEGLATCPRAYMETQKLEQVMKLTKTQHLILNLPVSKK